MRLVAKLSIGLSVSVLGVLMMTPCFATAVLEGAISDSLNGNTSVQLIEGGDIKNTPPIPRLYGETAINITSGTSQNLTSVIVRYNRQLDQGQVSQISQTIHLLSDNYGLDPKLLASLVAVESSFNPRAISRTGAIGLGQLKPATAQWLGVNDPYDPSQNLTGVAKYLRYLLDRYNGSVPHALAAYFQGQGTIDKRGIDDGARYYISKVSRVFEQF